MSMVVKCAESYANALRKNRKNWYRDLQVFF